ncbi:RrF2 family transcriptional regulator [Lacrimispora brassicae]
MKISTKGRYAVRLMIDLAEHNHGEYIPLMDIAKRQEISEKYLESIVSVLSKSNLLISLRGKGGGYKLAKKPEDYTVGTILRLTEGPLAPVSCLEGETNDCARASRCQTLPMWEGLNKLINDYFDGITIADLVPKSGYTDDYII